jgi:hypothetical protein
VGLREPRDVLNWALFLSFELIVLLAVWLIARRYED